MKERNSHFYHSSLVVYGLSIMNISILFRLLPDHFLNDPSLLIMNRPLGPPPPSLLINSGMVPVLSGSRHFRSHFLMV